VRSIGRQADDPERLQPCLDARPDRIDERPVEVEDDAARVGQVGQ
jgi:hypothetical protein